MNKLKHDDMNPTCLANLNVQPIAVHRGPGIYFLLQDDELIYIGRSENVTARIGIHAQYSLLQFNRAFTLRCQSRTLKQWEARLIYKLKPAKNQRIAWDCL